MIKAYQNIGETLHSETFPNGLTVHVVPKPGYNKSYAFFATDYGGADRRFKLDNEWIDSPAGVAHFLEHKLFDMPDGENALNILSANGASPNAFTSSGMTAYYFESTEAFEENLKCLLEFVTTPWFTPESVSKEQGIIGQEIRMCEDNPYYVAYYNLLKCLYSAHPVRDSVAGTIESISEITDKTLYACHKVFYNPSNMTLCIVGDVDPEKIISLSRELLPKEPGPRPGRDYGEEESGKPPRERSVSAVMEVAAPYFILGSRVEVPQDGDALLRKLLVGRLALSCLLGRSSEFYTRLYAEGLLNDTFSSDFDYVAKTAMFLCEGETADPAKVFDELCDEIKRVCDSGLDRELFERVKKAAYGRRLRSLGQFETLCRELAEGQFAGYCVLDAFQIIPGITYDETVGFIRENLIPERLAASIINPRSAD